MEYLAAGLQDTGVSIFLGSAVLGAVLGIAFKRFNLIYLATHTVCLHCYTIVIFGKY